MYVHLLQSKSGPIAPLFASCVVKRIVVSGSTAGCFNAATIAIARSTVAIRDTIVTNLYFQIFKF